MELSMKLWSDSYSVRLRPVRQKVDLHVIIFYTFCFKWAHLVVTIAQLLTYMAILYPVKIGTFSLDINEAACWITERKMLRKATSGPSEGQLTHDYCLYIFLN